jgi:hypothetical protein
VSAHFNKGIVSAQWVSRALAASPKGSKIGDLIATADNPLRNALSGLLRPNILSLLEETAKGGGQIFAALYELNDPELVAALTALGKNCHLILANGAFSSSKPDENAAVRKQLHGKVDLHDRMVTGSHFAHNKFVVFCDTAGKPQRVLTGSTNWTMTGLCTQANNGLIINDAGVAQDFLNAWNRLKAAGNDYPKELVDGNSTATTFEIDGAKVTPWFVKTSAAQDLAHARRLIEGAQDGILFLFFNPGVFQEDPRKWTLLQNILDRHNPQSLAYKPGLYMCGVVNQDIPHLTKLDPSQAKPVTLFANGKDSPQPLSHAVLVPHNIKDQFSEWVPELLGAGVHIHSKVIVIDPFGAHPVVMTGSHNLGLKASSENDDNLVIIEGNAPLAASYAINIVATFQTYRWNNYVEQHRKDPHVWHGLVDNDEWQGGYLQGDDLRELQFWMGEKAVAAMAAGADETPPATAPRHAVRAVKAKAEIAPPKKAPVKKR